MNACEKRKRFRDHFFAMSESRFSKNRLSAFKHILDEMEIMSIKNIFYPDRENPLAIYGLESRAL